VPGSLFISIEGGEGTGKSTQAEILHRRLWSNDIQAALVHEPGTTSLGTYLRNYLKGKQPLSKEAELLLFEAARAQLVIEEIKTSLESGMTVIADRFEASSTAYQGYGRRIDLDVISRLNEFATQGINPHTTFLLDLDPAEGLRRVGNPQLSLQFELDEEKISPRLDIEGHRRFEDQPLNFHTRVRNGFLTLAREDPDRWIVLDATKSVEDISDEIWTHVLERLELPKPKLR
jgi:dTMP kinase